jgi:hypothetical protein
MSIAKQAGVTGVFYRVQYLRFDVWSPPALVAASAILGQLSGEEFLDWLNPQPT